MLSDLRTKRSHSRPITLPPEEPLPNSLRIGLFTESFSPVRNGVATSLSTLITGLRNTGHRVWVCAPAHEQQDSHETNVLRFPSFVTACNKEYPVAYPFYPRLALSTHFNRLKLDVVHTHTPFILGLTGARLAVTRGTPLISTYHTFYTQYTHYLPIVPESMSCGLLDVYLPWYYNRCSTVICPSNAAAASLTKMGVEAPIEVIPTGIPLPEPFSISQESRAKTRDFYGWKQNQKVLMYAGRLAEEKNVAWLFNVLARVMQKFPDTLLVLAGDGPDKDLLESAAREAGLSEAVRFLGFVPRNEIAPIFSATDVFCFPSISETQGLVVGEARAAGLPVVIVESGGAPEMVSDGEDGYRVPVNDLDLFVARIDLILSSSEHRAKLSAAALRRARLFTPEIMLEKTISVYGEARNRPPEVTSLVPPSDGKASYWNIFSPR